MVGLVFGEEMNEIVFGGVLLNGMTIAYVSQMWLTAMRLASSNMLQVEEVRILGVQDRLRHKGKKIGVMKYFYTRQTLWENLAE